MKMKNYHNIGNINPERVYDSLHYLVKNHPAYKDIKIEKKEDWIRRCESTPEDDDVNLDQVEDNAICSDHEKDADEDSEETIDDKNNPDEAESNDFNANTCLYPKEPASNIIVNHSDKKITVRKRRKGGRIYDYAPGQEQAPTNWIREKNYDEVAFPELYTNGKGGVNDESRKVKITKPDFMSQKFLNHNKMYAQNSEYLFVSQQFLERHLLENNVSVFGQKGKAETGPDGTTILTCNNAFNAFSKIPGTPSYWKISETSYLQEWNN